MDFRERRYLVVGIMPESYAYGNHLVDIYKIAKTIPSTKIKYINYMPYVYTASIHRLLISCRRECYDELINILDSKFNEYVSLYGLNKSTCPFRYKEVCNPYRRKHIIRYRHKYIKQLDEKLKNCYNVIDNALNESSRSEDITDAIELLRKHNTTGASVIKLSNGKITERDLINKILDNYELLVDKLNTCEKLLKSSTESIEALTNMKV